MTPDEGSLKKKI